MEKILSKNLKDFRVKLGLTQDQIADYLEISREEVSYYETNRRSVPVDLIPTYAKLFGIDEYDLYEEDAAINNLNLAFAFRANEISPNDLKVIADFKKIALNYLKIKNVLAQ
ncbi:helix-turn-helix transcriptional regulator [Sphingobacterium humi]|nr:helix-turn-helix transcriptional regulator [Sphingobacterium humi]